MPREFDCCECGRKVLRFGRDTPDAAGDFCAHCLALPGWSTNPALRDLIDPTWIDAPLLRASGEKASPKATDEGQRDAVSERGR